MDKHYKELDSLRGLAALTVMVQHILFLFPAFYGGKAGGSGPMVRLIKETPLGIIFAGRQAVIFFFVLSGFVLSLSYLRPGKAPGYREFVIKRVCRIYLPYLAAVIVAVGMNMLCYRGPIPELSGWFAVAWRPEIDWHVAFQHLLLIGSFDSNRFNPVFWTLVLEMRISLFMPLIAMCAVRFAWGWNLLAGFVLCAAGWGSFTLQHMHILKLSNDYLSTLCYIIMFIVGALLAKHRHALAGRFLALGKGAKYACLGLALLAYTNTFWLEHLIPVASLRPFFHTQFTQDIIITAAVAALIVMSLASGKMSGTLTFGPVHFLGKISYSFYLFHAIWLLAFVHLWYGKIPLGLIIFIMVITSFVFAALSYHLLELPSIRLGRWLTRKPASV